ncbi:2233_t:CDS:1, partial [Cetraspora pellucida]
CNLNKKITLQKIYYRPEDYYWTAEKIRDASRRSKYNFLLAEICNWLNKQAIFQVHKPPPRYISQVLFNTIQIPNECHQADILYMPYNKIEKITYMFCFNVVDIAFRYKASVLIRGIIPNINIS